MDFIRNTVLPITGIFIIAFVFGSCNSEKKPSPEYVKEVNDWHEGRIDNLEGPEDWLKLAGLYRIEEGTHTFGADSTNDFIFPPKAAADIGTISRNDTTIIMEINDDVTVTQDQDSISEVSMIPSKYPSGTRLAHRSFRFFLVETHTRYYLRLVDDEHPNIAAFNGIERFPIKPKWKVKAQFRPFDEPKPITLPDVVNEGIPDTVYGRLEFTIDGEEFSLAPLHNPAEDDKLFIIFGDETNGDSTYGGGKYLYIPMPDENGETYLDFNKSYNPPCVFTEFATCALPPPQNRLSIEIPAGEKMYDNIQTY